MSEKVSIILPTFNGEKYLKQSIESCLNQTYKNIELIIVNDCSTDNTLNIIHGYSIKDNRIKIINNKENLKLPKSLNIGFSNSNGNFLTWTSDDNYYEPTAIEEMMDIFISKPENDLVYTSYKIFEDNKYICDFGDVPESLIFKCSVGASFLFKKKIYDALNGYDENKFLVEDFDFWLRAKANYNFYFLNEILYNYRRHNRSLSHRIHTDNNTKKEFQRLHFDLFDQFYNITLKEGLSRKEIECIVNIYLNEFLFEKTENTILFYNESLNLLNKMETFRWSDIGFNQKIMKNVINEKKEYILKYYINEMALWKNETEKIRRWYFKEYEVLPLWYKQIGHLIKWLIGKRKKLL